MLNLLLFFVVGQIEFFFYFFLAASFYLFCYFSCPGADYFIFLLLFADDADAVFERIGRDLCAAHCRVSTDIAELVLASDHLRCAGQIPAQVDCIEFASRCAKAAADAAVEINN